MRNCAHLVSDQSRWLRLSIAIAAAAALAPSSAHASSKLLNDKPLFSNKAACPAQIDTARIILGGAPSALDRVRADQQGTANDGLSLPPARACDALTVAVARNAKTQSLSGAFARVDTEYDATAELGTKAIPVKRTRFDDLWERVRRAAPAALMHAELRRANAAPGLGEPELLARVNQWVNREIAYVTDDRNYRQRDFWATAEQTLSRGSGDCEDFAILKMQMLRAGGVDADRMKLVLLRDLAANADHAFLLVQTDAGKVVLDNMTNRLYDGSRANSVRPVLSFSGNRRWVHAYRGAQPSPNPTAIPASRKSSTLALNNQRSVKADPLTFKTGFNK